MLLESGLRFCVAPHFHCAAAWAARVRVNGGTVRTDTGIHPRDDWRSASSDELRLLIAPDAEPLSPPPTAHLQLLLVPPRLRERWWELVQQSGDVTAGAVPGYDRFADDLLEFLRFKRLPVPTHCVSDVVVSRPGQSSTCLDDSGERLSGLGYRGLAPRPANAARGIPVAAINLGDEATHIVFLNLTPEALRAYLTETGSNDSASDDEALQAFAVRHPEYPLVGVRLDPGEGLWLPTPPPAFDGWTVGKQDLDAVLILQGTS